MKKTYLWSGMIGLLLGMVLTPAMPAQSGGGTITVITPNGGEIWHYGELRTITWNAQGISDPVVIELLQNGMVTGTIDASVPATSGQYVWRVGQLVFGTFTPGSDFRIRVRAPDIYYIDNAGIDASNINGRKGQEWASLSYACSRVSAAGSIIHVNAGTYIEAKKCNLATGVSIEGEGVSSHITTTYNINDDMRVGCIELKSPIQGTIGQQHIANIKFDGNNLAAQRCIVVFARSHVSVHNCTFINFRRSAIEIHGVDVTIPITQDLKVIGTEPTIWGTGNKVYNNMLTNSAGYYDSWSSGAIEISGQDNFSAYDNECDSTARIANEQGYLIKCYQFMKNCSIYRNTMKRTQGTAPYNLGMELWDGKGGNTIHDNALDGGCIDIAGHFSLKGDSAYSYDIHHNILRQTGANKGKGVGIIVEGGAKDVIIRNNIIEDFYISVGMTVNQDNLVLENIHIGYNIMKNPGSCTVDWGSAFIFGGAKSTSQIRNVFIYNNVIDDDGVGYDPRFAFYWYVNKGSYTNFFIKNNIIQGLTNGVSMIQLEGTSPEGYFNNIDFENNVLFNNGFGNNPWFTNGSTLISLVPDNYKFINNIKLDPKFVTTHTDFRLQATSPAINAGIDVGLTTDYAGVAVANPPEIGAYEYVETSLNPVDTTDCLSILTAESWSMALPGRAAQAAVMTFSWPFPARPGFSVLPVRRNGR